MQTELIIAAPAAEEEKPQYPRIYRETRQQRRAQARQKKKTPPAPPSGMARRSARRAIARVVWNEQRKTAKPKHNYSCGACKLPFIGPAANRCQCKPALARREQNGQ